jgi:hypothetical protein
MLYKLYRYELSTPQGKEIHPDKHYAVFDKSKGKDDFGELTEYRGRKDSVLMYLRDYHFDFIGLVGRHSTEREVTAYDEREDQTEQIDVDDDDYPHAPFICMPRLRMIACVDSAKVRADGAMMRLHQIIAHRLNLLFIVEAITETFDLRKAVKRFRVVEVTFEILPVNPHSDDLGLKLDESRKMDHIKKILGTAHAAPADPMKLDGGFLTAVQQLQQSGHAKVGFVGHTEDRVEVKVPKPSQPMRLSSADDEFVTGENVGVRIIIKERHQYPFSRHHVNQVRAIARRFRNLAPDESDE